MFVKSRVWKDDGGRTGGRFHLGAVYHWMDRPWKTKCGRTITEDWLFTKATMPLEAEVCSQCAR